MALLNQEGFNIISVGLFFDAVGHTQGNPSSRWKLCEITFRRPHVFIDMGLPLDFRFDQDIHDQVPLSLTSLLYDKNAKIDAVLLSHTHLDHFGLAGLLPPETPVYCGEASAELMEITSTIIHGEVPPFQGQRFRPDEGFQVGPFSITPYLMDHSACLWVPPVSRGGAAQLFGVVAWQIGPYPEGDRGYGWKGFLTKLVHEMLDIPGWGWIYVSKTADSPNVVKTSPNWFRSMAGPMPD